VACVQLEEELSQKQMCRCAVVSLASPSNNQLGKIHSPLFNVCTTRCSKGTSWVINARIEFLPTQLKQITFYTFDSFDYIISVHYPSYLCDQSCILSHIWPHSSRRSVLPISVSGPSQSPAIMSRSLHSYHWFVRLTKKCNGMPDLVSVDMNCMRMPIIGYHVGDSIFFLSGRKRGKMYSMFSLQRWALSYTTDKVTEKT
jgi:hypothetical protein